VRLTPRPWTANQFVEDADPDAAAFRNHGAELISVAALARCQVRRAEQAGRMC